MIGFAVVVLVGALLFGAALLAKRLWNQRRPPRRWLGNGQETRRRALDPGKSDTRSPKTSPTSGTGMSRTATGLGTLSALTATRDTGGGGAASSSTPSTSAASTSGGGVAKPKGLFFTIRTRADALAAVKEDGMSILGMHDNYKKNREVVLEAIVQNHEVFTELVFKLNYYQGNYHNFRNDRNLIPQMHAKNAASFYFDALVANPKVFLVSRDHSGEAFSN